MQLFNCLFSSSPLLVDGSPHTELARQQFVPLSPCAALASLIGVGSERSGAEEIGEREKSCSQQSVGDPRPTRLTTAHRSALSLSTSTCALDLWPTTKQASSWPSCSVQYGAASPI